VRQSLGTLGIVIVLVILFAGIFPRNQAPSAES
jgi:hypothetical protein